MDPKTLEVLTAALSKAESSDVGIGGSTRVKIAAIALLVIVLIEVLHQYGIEVSDQTLYSIEAVLILLGLSDGQRRLGHRPERTKPTNPNPSAEGGD